MRKILITENYTNVDSESLRSYLNEIYQIPQLSKEEEDHLAEKAAKGDEEAKHKLVKHNLRFVVSVAKQYTTYNAKLEDLVNEGNIGLQTATHKFDPNKGFKFISYAVWWIRKTIMDYINTNKREIRVPINKSTGVVKVNKKVEELEQRLGRTPTTEEVANDLENYSKQHVRELEDIGQMEVDSMDKPLTEEGFILSDIIENTNSESPETPVMQSDKNLVISKMFESLTQDEKLILERTFGINNTKLSLKEVGEEMGISREYVRKIRNKAIEKLKEKADEVNFDPDILQV